MGATETIRDIITSITTAGGSQKLITILRERLTVLQDEIVHLANEKALLFQKVLSLQQELAVLESDNAALAAENAQLKLKNEKADPVPPLPKDFDDSTVALARAFFENGPQITADAGLAAGLSDGMAQFHADLLKREGLLEAHSNLSTQLRAFAPSCHTLTAEGRAFIVRMSRV